MRNFTTVIEKCPDTGLYVGYVPEFPGAHSQGETLEELNRNLRVVIEMLLGEGEAKLEVEFLDTTPKKTGSRAAVREPDGNYTATH